MEMNLDVARCILSKVAALPDHKERMLYHLDITEFDPQIIVENAVQLVNAGYLDGKPHRNSREGGYDEVRIQGITAEGQMILARLRQE